MHEAVISCTMKNGCSTNRNHNRLRRSPILQGDKIRRWDTLAVSGELGKNVP
jgi:hypothetical protein